MEEVRLYRKNQLGIGTWRIRVDEELGLLVYSHAIVEGGAEVTHSDAIETNQSGRTWEQQAELEMNSRISRMMDKGYKRTREEALQGATNQLGMHNPMLAHPIERVKNAENLVRAYGAYVQRKYDGHRCLITKQGDTVFAYTRKGKPITTINHVLEDVQRWLPDGHTIDGELYTHGTSLQDLSSAIKRQQDSSNQLIFVWYDVMLDQGYDYRWNWMEDHFEQVEAPSIVLAPTYRVSSVQEAYDHFRQFRTQGYEGAMLRLPRTPYQPNVRSSSLLKLKEWQDEEVTVVGVKESKDGWAILVCKRDTGQVFDTSAPGTLDEKAEVLLNFESKYKGRRLTVEYANLTADGLPFHCTALRWHEEL